MSQALASIGGDHPVARRLIVAAGRPSTWVVLAILAVPLGSQMAPSGATATPSDAALVMAALISLVAVLRGHVSPLGAHALRCARSVPAAGLLVLAVVSLVATLLATDFPGNVVGAVRFLEIFALGPFAVMVALRTRLDACLVVGSLVALALLEGAVGVWQYLTGHGAGINGESIRAVGTFGAYNILSLATLCGLGVLAALAVAVVVRGRLRLIAGAVAAGLTIPLFASLSRASYVAVVAVAVVVVSRGRPRRLLAALAVAGLAAALVIPPLVSSGSELGQRVSSLLTAGEEPDQSVKDRLALWEAARHMATDHPLTGIGPRAFPDHRDAYADLSLLGSSDISFGSDFQRVALNSPHDLYLLIASEQGLVAALAYVTVFAVLLVRSLIVAARRRSDATTALALVAAGMFTYELIISISGDLGGPGSIFVALSVGLAARAAADIDLTDDTSALADHGHRDAVLLPAPQPQELQA
jgi:O-antigen ligase